MKNHPAFLSALLLLALATSARASDPLSLEDRLRALETKVGTLEQENAALRQQLAAPPTATAPVAAPSEHDKTPAALPALVVPNGHETRISIGGYTQVQAEFGDAGDPRFVGTNDRIYFRRSRLNIIGNFPQNINFKVEGEYSAGGSAPQTGVQVHANELYLSWNRYAAATIRLGQLKTAFGTEQLNPEYRGGIIERTLGIERISDGRQLAAELSGALFNQRVNYILLVGNGNGSNSTANDNSKFLKSAHGDAVVHDSPTAGRLVVGGSVLYSKDSAVSKLGPGFDSISGGAVDNLFAGTRDGFGVDASWHFGLFDLSTELLQMHYRPLNRIPAASFLSESWHVTVSYYLVPEQWQVAVRREHFDPYTALTGSSSETWWVGLNYYLKGDYLKIMADYAFGHPAGLSHDHGRFFTRFQVIY